MLHLVPLIPLLPLAGFLVCGLAGRRAPKVIVTIVACGSVLAAFALSVGAARELAGGPDSLARWQDRPGMSVDAAHMRVRIDVWDWFEGGPVAGATASPAAGAAAREIVPAPPRPASLRVPLSFSLDPLSAVMILVVTGVGFLIHLYSVGYMGHDPGYARYFAYLNLFTAMMLTLVLGANFLVLFVGWEGVGLCSYLLIGFWYDDPAKATAGRKAFIVNRIGDLAFILAMLGIAGAFGTLDIAEVMRGVEAGLAGPAGSALVTAIALALFVGACGKSAQIPLHVWLPDAMAGPTPVSALIHAATMVTAGVYMVSRCAPLYLHAPAAMAVVAVVGGATALFAATIGLAQNDIKKVLAYSTVSQLGLMFLGAGVGAFVASIFHLVTHAFFKALLFLGSGSVIHAMGGEQDMRRMGGLKAKLPVTYWTFLVGAVAIAGVPPLAGFFSKDEILAGVWGAGHPALWAVGTAASLCTALYMFRLVLMTFHGSFRGTEAQREHLHESPASMTVPLAALALLAIAGGWIGVPAALGEPIGVPNAIEHWLEPAVPVHGAAAAGHAPGALHAAADTHEGGAHGAAVLPLMLVAILVAAAGIAAAWMLYRPGSDLAGRAARAAGPLRALLSRAYWVDELYAAVVLRPYDRGCALADAADRRVVDGAVNAPAGVAQGAAQLLRLLHTGLVRNYALLFLLGSSALLWYLMS